MDRSKGCSWGIGQAGVVGNPIRMWIDDWAWRSKQNDALPSQLSVNSQNFSVNLTNFSFGPLIANGENGYEKITQSAIPVPDAESNDLAIYSFSQPFVKTKGVLEVDGKEIMVRGLAWVDKEWGTT